MEEQIWLILPCRTCALLAIASQTVAGRPLPTSDVPDFRQTVGNTISTIIPSAEYWTSEGQNTDLNLPTVTLYLDTIQLTRIMAIDSAA